MRDKTPEALLSTYKIGSRVVGEFYMLGVFQDNGFS